MKTYLLTEDQIERMLACAIEHTALIASEQTPRDVNETISNPEEAAHANAKLLFIHMQQLNIINEINQN